MLSRDRALLLKITLCYGIFVIFGSWVPFNVNSLSFGDAVNAFMELNKFDFSIVNRSDWFTNFLLFMPLSYLLFILSSRQSSALARTIQLISICIVLLSLSVGIEFVQLFLNDRVSSFKDVFAQFLGMITSFVLYFFTRDKFTSMVHELNRHGGDNKWITYANGALTVLVIYSVMPLDLSISPVELFKKWQEGRITLLPFTSFDSSISEWLFGILSDIFLWGFITWLYVKSAKYTPSQIVKRCLFYAVGIELAQLLVLSRYTDSTDIVTALMGILLALKFFANSNTGRSKNGAQQPYAIATNIGLTSYTQELILFAWCIMLFVFATYPFELVANKQAVLGNWHNFFSAPLETYWREGPLQAVTQLLRKVLLVIPLGLLLASISAKHQLKKESRILFCLLAVMFLFGLELLQIVMANKVAVATDVVLNLFGLFLGWKVFQMHSGKQGIDKQDIAEQDIDECANSPEGAPILQQGADYASSKNGSLGENNTPVNTSGRFIKFYPLVVFGLIFLGLILIQGDPRTPYNIKELFDSDWVWLSAAMMSLSFLVALGLPGVALNLALKLGKTSALWLFTMTLVHTLLVFNLFYLSFPIESLHDILGYPTWREQSHYLELCYRFVGFYLPISGAFFMVYSWFITTQSVGFKASRFAFSLLYTCLMLPIAYLIVVVQAGTDNITELLPNDGYSFKLLNLVAYIVLLVWVSTWWVKNSTATRPLTLLVYITLTLLSAPLGFYLLQHGMQDVIIKYGRVFSSLQFILSPSRDNLLTTDQMFIRYTMLHFMLLGMFFIAGFSARAFSFSTKRNEDKHTILQSQRTTASS
ncbi:hypothetical protein GMES_0899 [Paraglaciecola mesophila KMM 241]|uniref:VanZ-like domain-containing protein n=1 Tax=Paraglaciecola mesophila KMM 241 TaxID=1128912 RepID=K6XRF2_9ALTE|nr:VanZ family protein [Paraglaciecola mesophila]GAC23199.1 hypothetical protein GMES_0899 [Paraglaciecola mesophila KMM 241]